jgi:hypothetical protein
MAEDEELQVLGRIAAVAGALPYRAMIDMNWQLTAASAVTYPTGTGWHRSSWEAAMEQQRPAAPFPRRLTLLCHALVFASCLLVRPRMLRHSEPLSIAHLSAPHDQRRPCGEKPNEQGDQYRHSSR